jgi:hypothetical protein
VGRRWTYVISVVGYLAIAHGIGDVRLDLRVRMQSSRKLSPSITAQIGG